MTDQTYMDFLKSKVRMAQQDGITLKADSINPRLKPHQAAMVDWLVSGGRRACFASFGLGKSVVQLEALRIILESEGGRALIVCPLGVRQEFVRDAKNILGWTVLPKFIRRIEEAEETGIYITNYETVRDGKLDPAEFIAVTLDEAAILRGFGGSKTFREFMLLCTGDGGPTGRSRGDGKVVKYRFVATATPSPNEYIELLAYADFLGVMDVSQAKTRFFKRDSTKADKLTLHSHKEEEFWLWVASWALFVQKPSDLGFSDEGYALPDLEIKWHQVASDYTDAGYETNGQKKLLRDAAIGVQDAAAEKRSSMGIRIGKVLDLLKSHHASESGDLVSAAGWQSIVWCDLNPEQDLLESRLKAAGISASSIRGSDELDGREATLNQWLARETSVFLSKPSMYGAGVNLQQCHHMVFAGIGFKFADVIQAVHRIHRFLQREKCNVEFIFTEAEYAVKKTLERKWKQHTIMINKMTEIIQKFGLSQAAMAQHLTRKMGVDEPLAVEGERFRLVNDDTVKQTAKLEEDSIDLVVTSIPFSTQYEYSPNYADFGHSEGNDEFFGQMDYLTPELFRALKPGRLACIHVKDRIVPGGMTGLGFQTVYPFHARTMDHFMKHGFAYMGMKTIVTDVVRENNQTYRLGWTEQCKDGSKMGVGMPEYLLIFRKPPTDTANSYADEPVVKSKREYSRSRWQIDAHGFTRSSGDRPLTCEDLKGATHADIFQLFKQHSLETVYNFEHHVKFGEEIDKMKMLPVTFMLLQPQSWSDEVWTDVTRMRTLNGSQWSKGKEMHLCPMQFDIADRCIEQFSQKGEIVFDPFSGLGTVPQRAVLKGRRGLGFELNPGYFLDSVSYLQAAEAEVSTPSLFDLVEIEAANIARR